MAKLCFVGIKYLGEFFNGPLYCAAIYEIEDGYIRLAEGSCRFPASGRERARADGQKLADAHDYAVAVQDPPGSHFQTPPAKVPGETLRDFFFFDGTVLTADLTKDEARRGADEALAAQLFDGVWSENIHNIYWGKLYSKLCGYDTSRCHDGCRSKDIPKEDKCWVGALGLDYHTNYELVSREDPEPESLARGYLKLLHPKPLDTP